MAENEKSLPQLMRELVDQVSRMLRHEIDLARAEAGQKASQASSGATMLAVALVLGLGAVVTLLFAAVAALNLVMDAWLAALIVGGVAALIAAMLALKGRSNLKARNLMPSRTIETVRSDARFAKEKVQ